jgi:hypothetical protein
MTGQQPSPREPGPIFSSGLRLARFLSPNFDVTRRRSDSLGIPGGAGKGNP